MLKFETKMKKMFQIDLNSDLNEEHDLIAGVALHSLNR